MARRLALLALLPLALACAVAAHRPSVSPTLAHHAQYDYDSLDPFAVWDDYNPYETSPAPRLEADKPSAKVILRGHVPKTNVSTINSKGRDKNKVIKTSIKIESYTNIIVTKSPQVINRIKVVAGTKFPHQPTKVPVAQGWEEDLDQKPSSTTKRSTAHRSTTPRRATTTVRPTKTTRRATIPTVPSRRPTPSRQPTPSRRPANKPRTTTKKPKPLKNKKPCSQKNVGWVLSFFQENDLEKSPKNEVKPGWFVGIFSSIYKWLWGRSSWFGGVWLDDTQSKHSSTTSTTAVPLTTSTDNWFQAMLHSEENDVSLPSQSVKKPPKKSLKKNYKGFQLLRAYPDVQWKVQEMLDLQEEGQGSGLMWWTSPSLNGSTDLLVPPDLLEDVRAHLKSNKIEFDVIIYDLQKAIAYENPRLSKKQRIELELLRGHPMTWRRYHRYADILRYLEYLQHSNSEIVELVPLGRSSEGLPLVAVKVSLPSNETQTKELGRKSQKRWRLKSFMKPAVWLEGGAHAREWIAPAVATWMLHALVEGEKGLGPDYELLKMADFYILPVLNPDGYEHSHTHDRLWMKTRSRFEDRSEDYYVGWFPWNWGKTECVGVDTDRNWDYRWGEMDSSRDPCADNYAGPHPFSEPETRAVSEFLAEHRRQIKVYLSFHAYTQTWLTPSTEALTSYGDDGIMLEMGKLATAALADMDGSKYQVGTAAEIRQPASGMSHDWAKARAGIKFSYHVDLRDSFGRHGFLLPGSQIVPTARETWQAVKAIVDNLTPG